MNFGSSLDDWPSYMEEPMRPLFRASRMERLILWSRTTEGITALAVLWMLLLLACVVAFL